MKFNIGDKVYYICNDKELIIDKVIIEEILINNKGIFYYVSNYGDSISEIDLILEKDKQLLINSIDEILDRRYRDEK